MSTTNGNVQRHQNGNGQQSQRRPPARPATLKEDKCYRHHKSSCDAVYHLRRHILSLFMGRSSSHPRGAASHMLFVTMMLAGFAALFIASIASSSMHFSTRGMERQKIIGLRVSIAAVLDHSTQCEICMGMDLLLPVIDLER